MTYLEHLFTWERIKSFLLINGAGLVALGSIEALAHINDFNLPVVGIIVITAFLKQIYTSVENYISANTASNLVIAPAPDPIDPTLTQ